MIPNSPTVTTVITAQTTRLVFCGGSGAVIAQAASADSSDVDHEAGDPAADRGHRADAGTGQSERLSRIDLLRRALCRHHGSRVETADRVDRSTDSSA